MCAMVFLSSLCFSTESRDDGSPFVSKTLIHEAGCNSNYSYAPANPPTAFNNVPTAGDTAIKAKWRLGRVKSTKARKLKLQQTSAFVHANG